MRAAGIHALYNVSFDYLVALAVACELVTVPLVLAVHSRTRRRAS